MKTAISFNHLLAIYKVSAYQVCIQIVVQPGDQYNACMCNHYIFFLGITVLNYSLPAHVILRRVRVTE